MLTDIKHYIKNPGYPVPVGTGDVLFFVLSEAELLGWLQLVIQIRVCAFMSFQTKLCRNSDIRLGINIFFNFYFYSRSRIRLPDLKTTDSESSLFCPRIMNFWLSSLALK